MLALLLAAAASAAPTSPPAAEDVWRGTMSYPCTAACQHAGPWGTPLPSARATQVRSLLSLPKSQSAGAALY